MRSNKSSIKSWERPYPEKCWSLTKFKGADECPRRYYYETFGHWKGWERDADKKTQEIYRLKKLENVFTLTGKYIHEVIKTVALGNRSSSEMLTQNILGRLRKACYQSKNMRSQWERNPKEFAMLLEYYYDLGIDDQLANRIKDRIGACVENLWTAISLNQLIANESQIVEIEEDFPSFMLNEVRIYSTIDALYRIGDKWVIVDWKTGKEDKYDPLQLAIYVIYVQQKYDVKVENITCVNEYLETGQRKVFNFGPDDIKRAKEFILQNVAELDSYLLDVKTNQPKDEQSFQAKQNKHCTVCSFMGVCEKGQAVLKKKKEEQVAS